MPTLGPIFSLFTFHCIALAGLPHDIQNVDFIVPHKFKHYRVSQENQFNLKEFSQFFTRFFRWGYHLWTQFSQLIIGQIGKFLCLSDRKFPEFFETPPTFISKTFYGFLEFLWSFRNFYLILEYYFISFYEVL